MIAARAAKLNALGFAWSLTDEVWEAQLAKLKTYKRKHGDCSVPQGWAEDPALGSWVNNQRSRTKKKLDRGDPNMKITAARVAKLDKLGFTWELSAAVGKRCGTRQDDGGWEVQLAKLKEYKGEHGDCNVPRGWAEDPALGRWVHRQRGCKKKLDRGEPSQAMTAARAAQLDAVGFNWAPPQGAPKKAAAKKQKATKKKTAPKKKKPAKKNTAPKKKKTAKKKNAPNKK
jgi:hypothetical protein